MKNKTPSFAFLLFALTLLNSANPLLAQSVITGTLQGHDNKPMKKPLVLMSVGGAEEKTIIIETDEKGVFRHETHDSGLHFLNFVGVNHRPQQVVLYMEKPREVKINVTLTPPDYLQDLSRAELRGSNGKSRINSKRLEKQPDGKFVAVFETTEPSVEYLIRNATTSREPVTGTNAREYSILSYGGIKEKNIVLRQALWIKYLNMVFPHPETGRSTPSDLIDAKIISKALDELTPTSPFWMLRWLFPDDYLQKAVLATGQPDRYKDYAERSIESWPYGIRGWGFSGLMKKAAEKEETAEADRLYNRLQELSPESPGGKFEKLQRERKAAAKVVAGTQVPAFKAHSLGDTSVVYTPDNMQAKIYLIDFWATWCAPCIQEFPYLQKAYDQFHNKGFEILSYSLDASREVVVRFRKERFPMP